MKVVISNLFLFLLFCTCLYSTYACSSSSTIENPPTIIDPNNDTSSKWNDAEYMSNFVKQKSALLLDLTERNGETESETRNMYSTRYLYEVAGIIYQETTDLSYALANSDFIVLSSIIKDATFSNDELQNIYSWIECGGTLVIPAIESNAASVIFGFTFGNKSKTHGDIYWTEPSDYEELKYFDEIEERTISVGNISTYSYTAPNSDVLAKYGDGAAAVVRQVIGNGHVYVFPFQWRDMIQRSQLNKNSEASRFYNNGFEPSADCAPLFVRQAYIVNHDIATWKHTIPDGYASVLIPTHDIDSTTGYDSLFYMSQYETEENVKGHYNLTTKYFKDKIGKAYYIDRTKEIISNELVGKHTIGNHSVGHFPDMSDNKLFPMGDFNITKAEYNPYYDGKVTTGGFTYAEVAIAKNLLEQDFGIKVNTFRSGHLCMNKYIDEAMQRAGVDYASCWTAAGLLSEFPFKERMALKWSGEEAVLQIPMHVSDVTFPDKIKISESNYEERADIWASVATKLRGNYAPCVILIHPNRRWKMLAEKRLVNNLTATDYKLYNFVDYGDFWTNRSTFTYSESVNKLDDSVLITIPSSYIQKLSGLGIVITGKINHTENDIRIIDENGEYYPYTLKELGSDLCIVL